MLVLSVERDGSIAERMALPTQYPPLFMVVEDLDGDRAPEIALATGTFNAILILWNDRQERFPESSVIVLGAPALRLEAPDVDGDGDRDLVVLSGNSRVLLNVGKRNFSQQETIPVMPIASAASCDLDGDGDVDLAIAGETLLILLNVGAIFFDSREAAKLPGTSPPQVACGDLDGDGLADLIAARGGVSTGEVLLLRNLTIPPRSLDQNQNQVPDECEASAFRRGNALADGGVDLTDAVHILEFLFLGVSLAGCPDAADADDDGQVGITDPIRLLGSLFLGEGSLPPPATCGLDPTADGLTPCLRSGC